MQTKTQRNNEIMMVLQIQTAKRLIALKFRGVRVDSLMHSHTNDLGMIFKSSTGRRFLVRSSRDISEV